MSWFHNKQNDEIDTILADATRELHCKREAGLAARAKLEATVAERLGLEAETLTYIPSELIAAALLLGIKVGDGIRD